MTKALEKKAQKQYDRGNDMEQMIVAKFFNPLNEWKWYVMNQDPNDTDYLWGIVKGNEIEIGSFSLTELKNVKLPFGLTIERDKYWIPKTAKEVFTNLNNGLHQ